MGLVAPLAVTGTQMADGRKVKGILLMVGAAVLLAGMSAMFKVAGERISAYEVAFFRGLVGYVVMLGVERGRKGRAVRGVNRWGLFLRSLFGFTALILYVTAIEHIDLGLASALNQSSPLFVVLLSFALLGERPPAVVPMLAGVGFVGVWLIISPDLTSINFNATLGAVSALFAALAYIMIRKLRLTDAPWVIVRNLMMWTTVLAMPFMVIDGWLWPTAREWVALCLAAICGLAGQLLLTHAYRMVEAALVSPFLYFSVLTSFLVGWAFWGEWPTYTALLGCVMLVAACVAIGITTGRGPAETHIPPKR